MKYKLYTLLSIVIISGIVLSCNSLNKEKEPKTNLKYIFLFIGDGMGSNHVCLTEAYTMGLKNKIGKQPLLMTSFPSLGLCSTFSKNSNITDSGASGSAIACGEKTDNNCISYYPEEADPKSHKSIAKLAHENSFKVGIITTVSINHATPAVFYASNKNRRLYYEIGLELANSNFEFFGGGGFYKSTGKDKKQKDLYDITREKNYIITDDLKKVASFDADKDKVFITNPVLLDEAEMPYAIDRKYMGGYALSDFVQTAIEFLYNDTGFFIMVESGKIDWAAHSNDAASIVNEVQDFDNALLKAYNFYKEHPYETLIIVTADHETGGLALGNNQLGYTGSYQNLQMQKSSLDYFSRAIYNYKNNNTTYSIEDVVSLANKIFLEDSINLSKNEYQKIYDAYNYFFYNNTDMTPEEIAEEYGPYNPVAVAFTDIINTRSATAFTTWDHTGTKVPVFSIGVNSEMFENDIDNTNFFPRIIEIMNW